MRNPACLLLLLVLTVAWATASCERTDKRRRDAYYRRNVGVGNRNLHKYLPLYVLLRDGKPLAFFWPKLFPSTGVRKVLYPEGRPIPKKAGFAEKYPVYVLKPYPVYVVKPYPVLVEDLVLHPVPVPVPRPGRPEKLPPSPETKSPPSYEVHENPDESPLPEGFPLGHPAWSSNPPTPGNRPLVHYDPAPLQNYQLTEHNTEFSLTPGFTYPRLSKLL